MASPIHRKQENTAGTGVKPWVPMNRWSIAANYSIATTVTGAATYTVELTLDHVNRVGVTIDTCPVLNATDLAADACLVVLGTPAEAFRINQTAGAGSVRMHIVQSGESS